MMYPFLRTVEYRVANHQLVRLNKFGIHGLNFNTNHLATYLNIRDLHRDHMFYDQEQADDASKRLDAAIFRQLQKRHRPALVQVWSISSLSVRLRKRASLVLDGQRFAEIPDLLPGRHLLYEQEMQPGYYFVKPLDCQAEFFRAAPGGMEPYRKFSCAGIAQERYFAPGSCVRLSVASSSKDSKLGLYVSTDSSSTPDNTFVV